MERQIKRGCKENIENFLNFIEFLFDFFSIHSNFYFAINLQHVTKREEFIYRIQNLLKTATQILIKLKYYSLSRYMTNAWQHQPSAIIITGWHSVLVSILCYFIYTLPSSYPLILHSLSTQQHCRWPHLKHLECKAILALH